jgi:hypothetical protein
MEVKKINAVVPIADRRKILTAGFANAFAIALEKEVKKIYVLNY